MQELPIHAGEKLCQQFHVVDEEWKKEKACLGMIHSWSMSGRTHLIEYIADTDDIYEIPKNVRRYSCIKRTL